MCMRIVNKAEFGYQLVCESCGAEFESGRVGLAFECPGCGFSEMAAELVSEWTLGHPQPVVETAG